MKIKENFLLRQVADIWVVMPVGNSTIDFDGMLTLNETGAFLWSTLERSGNIDMMVDALTAEYDVSREQALSDVEEFCQKLIDTGCAEA